MQSAKMVIRGCGPAEKIFLYLALLAKYFGDMTLAEVIKEGGMK